MKVISAFWDNNSVSWYILHVIFNRIRKFAITRKYAPDENFWGHFCPRRKAANFCHPGLKHYCPMLNAALEWIDHVKNFVTPWIFVCVALYFFRFWYIVMCVHVRHREC